MYRQIINPQFGLSVTANGEIVSNSPYPIQIMNVAPNAASLQLAPTVHIGQPYVTQPTQVAQIHKNAIPLRKGKWTPEEEEYTSKIIQFFNTGALALPEGTTLRAYLAEKLHCDPMRITKKFTGSSCLGKRVYHSSEATPASATEVEAARIILTDLESKFWSRLLKSDANTLGPFGSACIVDSDALYRRSEHHFRVPLDSSIQLVQSPQEWTTSVPLSHINPNQLNPSLYPPTIPAKTIDVANAGTRFIQYTANPQQPILEVSNTLSAGAANLSLIQNSNPIVHNSQTSNPLSLNNSVGVRVPINGDINKNSLGIQSNIINPTTKASQVHLKTFSTIGSQNSILGNSNFVPNIPLTPSDAGNGVANQNNNDFLPKSIPDDVHLKSQSHTKLFPRKYPPPENLQTTNSTSSSFPMTANPQPRIFKTENKPLNNLEVLFAAVAQETHEGASRNTPQIKSPPVVVSSDGESSCNSMPRSRRPDKIHTSKDRTQSLVTTEKALKQPIANFLKSDTQAFHRRQRVKSTHKKIKPSKEIKEEDRRAGDLLMGFIDSLNNAEGRSELLKVLHSKDKQPQPLRPQLHIDSKQCRNKVATFDDSDENIEIQATIQYKRRKVTADRDAI
mmetsp:Transcript_35477/g.46825  ORF Transcript_35477/g.46825 Transcript_35477/m.46825 type:complete len:619 (+) Transcript_35477:166-2022(+)